MVKNNPDVDEVYIYEKAKHTPDKTKLSAWWDNLKVFHRIRKKRYDVAITCGSYSSTSAKYAFFSGAEMRIGYIKKGKLNLFYNQPMVPPAGNKHEVNKVFELLSPLAINGEPGKLILVPDAGVLKKSGKPLIAIAISARIEVNKWPADKFIALIDKILSLNSADVLLLWAPGSENNPTFPGDEENAEYIRGHFKERIISHPTPSLKSFIAAIALADMVVTLDTGSLHMAAALNKVTVALMTKKKALSWYPWKTENIVLTAENSVKDIRVDDVFQAVNSCIANFRAL